MSGIVSEAKQKIENGLGQMEGWFDDVRTNLAPVAERLEKLEASPVVQAIESAALSPEAEQMIARLIGDLGSELAKITPAAAAAVTAPAAPAAPEPDAQPADAAALPEPDAQPAPAA